jgi:hypothetical protein
MCSILTTIFRYKMPVAVATSIFSTYIVVYAILYPLLLELYKGDFDDLNRFWWLTSPIILSGFALAVSLPIGIILFKKGNIDN